MRHERELAEVKAEFLDSEGWMKKSPLPRDKVQRWLQSEDLEVLGAVHRLLHVKEHLYRVRPPLKFNEFFEFMTRYYRRCLREFSQQAWDEWEAADVGTEATHHIVYWFIMLHDDPSVPRDYLERLKSWMAETLRQCPQTRDLLAGAIHDHLLIHRKIGKLFRDWPDDAELSQVFAEIAE